MIGIQAWVTSALEEKAVTKALILAASLRHVRTAKKLAVLTTSAVPKNLRDKLESVFDMVVLIDVGGLNGLKAEDYSKIQAFSLRVFSKCVYLTCQSLVVKNCDDIFDKYGSFAFSWEKSEADTSVFLFTPDFLLQKALEKKLKVIGSFRGNFSTFVETCVRNQVPIVDELGKEYNMRLALSRTVEECLVGDVAIVTFPQAHPLDLPKGTSVPAGAVAKHAVECCWKLYQDVSSLNKVAPDFELSPPSFPTTYDTEPIAIVGLDFRLPGGNTPDEFWELLVNGREGVRPVPHGRWTKEHIYAPCKNRKVEAGFLNVPIDEFDAKFFGVSPKDAVFLDPQQRLLHEVAWCALEDAGIDPLTLHDTKTGIFVGSWIHDYKDLVTSTADVEFLRAYLGNSIAATSSRLSHFLGTTGPSIPTESGCSSGIVAVDMACKSLRNHESHLAFACGVNLLIHPFDLNTFTFVIAPDGRCKTFDAKADGFGRAEGCGVLLLKRLSDAVKDENKIWGLIRGSAITQEGLSKSLGTPTVHCESLAMELALKDAGVEPKDVKFVETHGTGTPVGDPMETAAIAKVYSKGRRDPLIIGSVKTNVGHTESVSGITGIIKVLLSMKHETIPPHLNFETLNPNINLDVIPAKIPLEPLPWPKVNGKPRLAGVSSFGISGTDGHIIIEEAPQIHKSVIDHKLERPLHIMKVSAKSLESFEKMLENYERIFMEKAGSKDVGFADIAHSANTGRSTFNHRAVIIAKDCKHAAEIIKAKSFSQADIPTQSSPICFLFTGQGSQYPNMAKSLYTTSPVFRSHFNECAEVLQTRYNIPIKQVLWGSATDSEKLSRTLYSQTSIFCVEYCLLKLWESWGVKPDFVMGHSLGEFAAAVAAGALGFEDALMLVAERSRLIDSLPRGKMLVIRADKKTVDHQIAKYKEAHPAFWADYAALNSSDQTVIAGDSQMIEDFAKFCGEKSLKVIVLAATHAFHSRHMDPMLEEYRRIASSVVIKPVSEDSPKYISGMEGGLVDAAEINTDYWVRHTREKVSFMDACKAVHSEGCTLFLELGPHPVLSALAMMNIEGASVKCLPSLRRTEDDWTTLTDSLSKLYLSDWKGEICWKGLDQHYPRRKVALPFYPFNRKPAWISVTRLIQKLHPLLGRILPNASNQTIYERRLTVKNTNFVQDHVIGNTIIFPGAGFLELTLAGGYAAVQGLTEEWTKPRRPIGLRGLKISSPLAIHDSDPVIIHTVVHLNDDKTEEDLSYSVAISRNSDPNNSCEGQWILHSSATFLPVANLKTEQLPKIDIPTIQNSCEKSENKEFYEKLPQIGLRFGPKFQSLQLGWRGKAGILTQVKVPEDFGSYLIHPVIGDAMLQALMMWLNKDSTLKKKLQVPVHIGEFTWLSNSESAERYIYCSNTETGPFAVLLDDQGTPLAYMADIDFAETTVKLIEGMISQQTSALPLMWEEVWKPKQGPLQNRLTHQVHYPTRLSDEVEAKLAQCNDLGDAERKFCRHVEAITHCFFLEALCKLGWKPEPRAEFTLDSLLAKLSIEPRHKMYVRYFLKSIATMTSMEGRLQMLAEDGSTFRFNSNPPTLERIVGIRHVEESAIDKSRIEYRLIADMGEVLHKVFTGATDPLGILFREDPSKVSTKDVYNLIREQVTGVVNLAMEGFMRNPILQAIEAQKCEKESDTPVLRILEVGAGIGALSLSYIQWFKDNNVPVEYYFTDISAAFFITAEKNLGELTKQVVFKRFNMEEDPFEQGFGPEYFDLIVAAEVIHVSKHIEKTLTNLRPLLKANGVLQIVETVAEDPRLTMVWGLLDGYWRFEDYHIRPFHVTLPAKRWEEVLHAADFPRVAFRPSYLGLHGVIFAYPSKERTKIVPRAAVERKHAWLIFDDGTQLSQQLKGKLEGIGRTVVLFSGPRDQEYAEESFKGELKSVLDDISAKVDHFEGILYLWGLRKVRDQTRISLPMLTLCQLLLECEKALPLLCTVTQGLYEIGDSEVLNPSAGSLHGLLGSVHNEEHVRFRKMIMDLSPTEPVSAQVEELFQNLWGDYVNAVAFRDGKRLEPKLAALKIPNECLALPSGCDRFQLQLPDTRLISDLEFIFLDHYNLGEDEVEVHVKAYALNFRDVFAVLKPSAQFDNFKSLGLDFSGVVSRVGEKVTKTKVGDKVIGFNAENKYALPSHITMKENIVIALPPKMTFAEGSTLPTIFATSYFCLVCTAKMKRGETVLIHTGSGGVGLCAIQVARQIGANIITTAGSPRKRNYLRNMGIEHVFHSRTTEFSKEILEVTGGRGVDVILNSLTGPGFKEASLDCLAKGGRFVEMSKLNVWKKEEVQVIRPDVFYEIVDLTQLKELDESAKELEAGLSNYMKPIAYDRFDALDIRRALNYLQKAKHIGKVVCIMPEVKVENSKLVATTPLFNEDSTYLISGGLGGIGFAVANWMLNRGAKHIVLAGRSPPKHEALDKIETFNKSGKNVKAFSVDIGDFVQVRQLFEEIQSPTSGFPPLRGVMHAAGVLQDSIILNQSWSTFHQTFNPKVNGSWNLHELTKDLPLEHFVLFSSFAGTFGSPGQANHSASNSFEDALAHYRKSNGLPATTINWANWGEVGVATEVDFPGIRPISTTQGLLALETFLKIQRTHTVVANIDSFALIVTLFPQVKPYVDDKRLFGDVKLNVVMNSDEFWAKVDGAESREDKLVVFKDFIKNVVRTLLKMDASEEIDDNVELQSVGVDSLMMLEMKNGMQNVLGTRLVLTVSQLKDCTTTELLANKFVDILEGEQDKANIPTSEELRDLIREDCILPEHIVPPPDYTTTSLDKMSRVLLTGVTGNLGPYLLRDLTRRENIEKVYCLIRKSGKSSATTRLHSKLKKIQLLEEVDMEKVECLQGDVTDPHFGLAEDVYGELGGSVDIIIHSAVRSDHTAKYWRAPPSHKSHVRTANVSGMVRILEFAVEKKLKHVYHAATLLTSITAGENGHLLEDWQDVGIFDEVNVNLGYPISKHVCEQLVKQAIERGIPCKALRLPFLGGDSRTGRSEVDTNHLLLRCLGVMKLGCMPDIPFPIPIIAVDKCAEISLQAFFDKRVVPDVYHICQRNPDVEQVLLEIATEFGVQIDAVPYSDFALKLESIDDNSPIAPFKKLYQDEENSNLVSPSNKFFIKYLENSQDFYTNAKMSALFPDFEKSLESGHDVLRRDLMFQEKAGVFKKFGIGSS